MNDPSTCPPQRRSLSGCLGLLGEILEFAYASYRWVLPFDRMCLALLDQDQRVLRVAWMRSEFPDSRIVDGFAFPYEATSLQGVVEAGQPRILDDVVACARARPSSVTADLLVQEGICSSLTVPVAMGDDQLGVLFFSSATAAAYEPAHVRPAQVLADRIAWAVGICRACAAGTTPVGKEAAPLVGSQDVAGRPLAEVAGAIERAHTEIRLISEIIEKINAGLLFHEVLDHVYDSFRSFLPVDRLGFARIEDDGRRVRAAWVRNDTSEPHLAVGYSASLEGSSLQGIIETGRPRILNDLEQYLREHPHSDSTRRIVAEGMRSSLTCPLVANGKPIGLLFFSSRKEGAYKASHVDIFQRVAGHVAVTVEKGWIHKQLLEEQQKSEALLHNTLPAAVASRLLEGETTLADYYAEATVLFADIMEFSTLAARMSPREVVRLLNQIFTAFDDLVEAHGIEKIKTIGDAYLAVAGLPQPRPDHALAVVQVGLALHEVVSRVRGPFNEPIRLRVGIHTGPVVAGVIGKRKFGYDIWGDTVNIASRMQSHGLPGRVQVTARTRDLLGPHHALESRGLVAVKGARAIEAYLVKPPGS